MPLFLCHFSFQRPWMLVGAVERTAVKVWILLHGRLILNGRYICSLHYFPFHPVVYNWSVKGCGVCCPVCGKVHIKDPLLLIGKVAYVVTVGFL